MIFSPIYFSKLFRIMKQMPATSVRNRWHPLSQFKHITQQRTAQLLLTSCAKCRNACRHMTFRNPTLRTYYFNKRVFSELIPKNTVNLFYRLVEETIKSEECLSDFFHDLVCRVERSWACSDCIHFWCLCQTK